MNDGDELAPLGWRPPIYRVRGHDVILDANLAMALGLQTKRLNESIKRHIDLIDDRHCFTLSEEEFAALRSQIATSNPGRGGRQYAPRVFTDRGVARVTTFINTPAALRAADLIIDTFMSVRRQIASGRSRIEIEQPSRYHLVDEVAAEARALRRRLVKAVDGLLDAVIDIRTTGTVRETAKDLTAEALGHLRERLREKGLENLKLEAETRKILSEAEKVAAEIRRADAETEGLHLDNLNKRIGIVRELMKLQRELEPNRVVDLLDAFDAGAPVELTKAQEPPTPKLPPPDDE